MRYQAFVLAFFGALLFLVLLGRISPYVLLLYCVASLICYGVYAVDKKAAEQGTWRVREDYLHLTALLGGWPGAILAQSKLRHKTKKLSFRVVFWITVAVNVSVLAYWISCK